MGTDTSGCRTSWSCRSRAMGTSDIPKWTFRMQAGNRTSTELDRFPILGFYDFIVLKALGKTSAVVATGASPVADTSDSASGARVPRRIQTGQNATAPENSLPQLGQTRRDSVFIRAIAGQITVQNKIPVTLLLQLMQPGRYDVLLTCLPPFNS